MFMSLLVGVFFISLRAEPGELFLPATSLYTKLGQPCRNLIIIFSSPFRKESE